MKSVLSVLEGLAEVEWARCVGGETPLRPPYLVWRFKQPMNAATQAKIVDALQTHSGAVKWVLHKGKRNFVIEPETFADFAKQYRVDVEASQQFGIEFPSETRAALSDVERLAAHLLEALITQRNA